MRTPTQTLKCFCKIEITASCKTDEKGTCWPGLIRPKTCCILRGAGAGLGGGTLITGCDFDPCGLCEFGSAFSLSTLLNAINLAVFFAGDEVMRGEEVGRGCEAARVRGDFGCLLFVSN